MAVEKLRDAALDPRNHRYSASRGIPNLRRAICDLYRRRFGVGPGTCPAADAAYEEILSLPMFATMTAGDLQDVMEAMAKVVGAFRRH